MKKNKKGKIILIVLIVAVMIPVIAVGGGYAVVTRIAFNTHFHNAMQLVDDNYENIYSVFGDKLPEKDAYMRRMKEVYDGVRPVLVPFNLKSSNLFGLHDSAAGMYSFDNSRLYLVMLEGEIMHPFHANDETTGNLLHELKHADDQKALWEATNGIGTEADIFTEGASSFWGNYPSLKNFRNDAYTDVSDEHDGSVLVGSSSYMYGQFLFQYIMYLTLTDYDTLHRYTESAGDEKIIKEKIRENYGSVADVDTFWDLSNTNSYGMGETYYYEQSEIFVNGFLMQDVERVSNREEAFRMLNLYRFLKAQVIPRCYNKEKAYCTYDYIDLCSIESALFEKVRAYGLLNGLTTDETQQRFLFDCLLYMPDSDNDVPAEQGDPYYEIQHIPLSLSSIRLVFNADSMTLQFVDPDSGEPFAQYVDGGLYQTIDIDGMFDEPLVPITGTQMVLS